MRTSFTIQDIQKSACGKLNSHITEIIVGGRAAGKTAKYGNKKVELDGMVFDSEKESKRYIVLKMLYQQGIIKDLQCQVEFELNECGTHSLKYVADFIYTNVKTGEIKAEDVKGYKTKIYKKKCKLMKKLFGITIKET